MLKTNRVMMALFNKEIVNISMVFVVIARSFF